MSNSEIIKDKVCGFCGSHNIKLAFLIADGQQPAVMNRDSTGITSMGIHCLSCNKMDPYIFDRKIIEAEWNK